MGRSRVGLALFSALLCAAPAVAQLPPLPAGWVRPTDADLQGNWEFRKDSPGRDVRIRADFNGDGRQDSAELLINRPAKAFALFAFLDGAPVPMELTRADLKFLGSMGIYADPPGRYETACGKGFDGRDPKCEHGQKFVDMRYPSIAYFVFESGGDNFYWDGTKFVQVWTSD